MNIQNSLKKLERVTESSTVCACYPQRNIETYTQDLGEDAEHKRAFINEKASPEYLPGCHKQIEKNSIIVQLMDDTTKYRFPEYWNANRDK